MNHINCYKIFSECFSSQQLSQTDVHGTDNIRNIQHLHSVVSDEILSISGIDPLQCLFSGNIKRQKGIQEFAGSCEILEAIQSILILSDTKLLHYLL